VSVGQVATIKVAAFPFSQYGTVSGTVDTIASDALSSADAQRSLTATAGSSRSATGGALEGLLFPVTIRIEDNPIMKDGTPFALSAGMSVVVEINTGSRSILEYLFSPLVEVGSTALRER
jgi:hemolysin D